MYVPGCVKTVHMRDGSSSSSLNANERTSVDHMPVELCDWNFRYISQFLQVGCGPVIIEMLPYPNI